MLPNFCKHLWQKLTRCCYISLTSVKAKVGDDGDTEDDIKTAFQEYDIDHDGYITKDEMVEVSSHQNVTNCTCTKFRKIFNRKQY